MEELDIILFSVLLVGHLVLRLVKHTITSNDITVADGLLLRFCQKSVELYGDRAIIPNMHMHCHLAACLREFGPIHSFWLFPFERYNGILEGQPSNNRSIEMQLMRRFQSDNLNMQLHQEAREWPDAIFFLDALPNPSHDILSPADFDTTVTPGPKSVMSSLSPELMPHLSKLYSKIYPIMLENGDIILAIYFYSVTVFAVPPFPFPCSSFSAFEAPEWLAKIEYFMLHTISLP